MGEYAGAGIRGSGPSIDVQGTLGMLPLGTYIQLLCMYVSARKWKITRLSLLSLKTTRIQSWHLIWTQEMSSGICEKFIWYIQFKINTCKMNWIYKRLGIVYLPPAIDSSCCNQFPNSDDLLWMVYYWRKKNGRSRVRDHMWNICAWLPIIPHLCRFATPSFNAVEKVRLWWRTLVWPLQNHPFMVVNVETT